MQDKIARQEFSRGSTSVSHQRRSEFFGSVPALARWA
jgi:hypothetical protein